MDPKNDVGPRRVGDRIRVAGWEVDPATGEIRRGDRCDRLQPKPMAVLALLIERRGEVVSKDDLLETVWADTAVTDDAVWRCVGELRRKLEMEGVGPVVETLPRRGYRLAADAVAEIAPNASVPAIPELAEERRRPKALLKAAVILLAVCAAALTHQGARSERSTSRDSSPRVVTPLRSAEDFYALGRSLYLRRTLPDLARARQLFEKALEIDPDFAPAHAALANAECAGANATGDRESLARGVSLAHRALEQSPRLADGYKALGFCFQLQGWFHRAAAAYESALEIEPEHLTARHNLAILRRILGRPDLALAAHRELSSRQPAALAVRMAGESRALYLLGELDEAEARALQAMELQPNDQRFRGLVAQIALQRGDLEVARQQIREAFVQHPDDPLVLRAASLAFAAPEARGELLTLLDTRLDASSTDDLDPSAAVTLAAVLNDGERRERLLGAVERREREKLDHGHDGWLPSINLAKAAALRDDRDEALDRLGEASRRGFLDHRWLTDEPAFASLRTEPRFTALLEGLEQRSRELRRSAGLES